MRLIETVEDGRFAVLSHADTADIVRGKASRTFSRLVLECDSSSLVDIVKRLEHGAIHLQIIGAPAEVHVRDGQAVSVFTRCVQGDPVVRVPHHFPEANSSGVRGLQIAHTLLERLAIAGNVRRMVRLHIRADVQLDAEPAGIAGLPRWRKPGDIGVVERAVLIEGLDAHEVLQITVDFSNDVPVEISPDNVVTVGQPVGEMP